MEFELDTEKEFWPEESQLPRRGASGFRAGGVVGAPLARRGSFWPRPPASVEFVLRLGRFLRPPGPRGRGRKRHEATLPVSRLPRNFLRKRKGIFPFLPQNSCRDEIG